MTTFMHIVRDVLFFAIWFGIPILVFLPRMKKREDIGKRMFISTLLVWLGLFLHCDFIHRPVTMALAEARGDMNYDGAGYGAAITILGWLFGIIGTAVAACGYLAIQYLRRRRHEHTTA